MSKIISAKVLVIEADSPVFERLEDFVWVESKPSGLSYEINKKFLHIYYTPSKFPSKKFIEKLKQIGGVKSIRSDIVYEQDWNKKWQRSVRPVWITDDIVVVPPFKKKVDKRNITKIIINPAMAFGTGHHESTQGIMNLIYRNRSLIRNRSIADFGSGSGILSIFARMLDSGKVDAYDFDPECKTAIYENMKLNKIKGINFFNKKIKSCKGKYDIIFANMLFGEISENKNIIIRSLNKNGYVFFSGILSCETGELLKLFGNMQLKDRIEINGWASLLMEKR